MPAGIDPVPVGATVIDCSAIASYLVDAPPGAMVGKQSSQEGFDEAALEVISNQAEYGVHIGITTSDIAALQQATERVAAIDAVLPAARKLVEMLEETRHLADHDRHMRIYELAALVNARSSARRAPELLARYEKTRAYRSAIGKRSWVTRRRNQQAAAGSPVDPPEPSVPDAPLS